MGCGKKDNDVLSHDNCICEVVRAIKDIQDTVIEENCECPSNCFNEPLGSIVSPATSNNRVNTRVIVLKTADGSPFHAFFKNVNSNRITLCPSIFFRVEEVFDNCCATLRVLVPTQTTSTCDNSDSIADDCCIDLETLCEDVNINNGFTATDDCITVDLNCFCAVQCIIDTHVDDVCD